MARTSLRYFKQVLSVVSQFDIAEEDCLSAVGLSEFPDSGRVEADVVAHILRYAESRLNDSQIGIKCGLKYPILQYNRPAEFLKFCENITHALDVYKTYCPLFHTVGTPSEVISEDGIDRMVWVPNFDLKHTDDYRQLIDLIMTNYVTSINWLAWKTPNAVKQLNFSHEAAAPIDHYQDLFECDVKFGQKEYSLILRDGVRDAPFSTSDPAELAKIRVKFDLALNELLEEESLIDRIELQIRRGIEQAVPNRAIVAKSLGLSERSMARSLADKGTSFKDIKSRVIRGLAVAKINQGIPLAEIAHSLGYNDQSAFTRAYKNWFGHPPGKSKTPNRD